MSNSLLIELFQKLVLLSIILSQTIETDNGTGDLYKLT